LTLRTSVGPFGLMKTCLWLDMVKHGNMCMTLKTYIQSDWRTELSHSHLRRLRVSWLLRARDCSAKSSHPVVPLLASCWTFTTNLSHSVIPSSPPHWSPLSLINKPLTPGTRDTIQSLLSSTSIFYSSRVCKHPRLCQAHFSASVEISTSCSNQGL
jgi:hypothetical protein